MTQAWALRLGQQAARDYGEIVRWTVKSFGVQQAEIYAKTIMNKRGLIILASPGGSGKTTSMAAMIGHRNRFGSGHILTIEDPIEFVHKHGSCIITQREMGSDTYSYGMALKNALRQRADVISIGEIRDTESFEYALRFAETGHLCIATLHSNNASQSLNRMVNMFPEEAKRNVLATISQNLLAIFAQRIIRNINNKNIVVPEILLNEGLIKTLISDNRLLEIREAMERNQTSGMQTFDQAIFKLYEEGKISSEVAIAEAENPGTLNMMISQTKRNFSSKETQFNKALDKNVF
ncbi:MAG: hypothetical protein EB015_20215 [Methylocystaceae bacterium]|nr:hypothetical protein [Methylocystaceae bacterium]